MKSRRIFVALMMAVFMAAMMAASAFATTSDPYMTSYELGPSGYVYTYDDLHWSGGVVTARLIAGPSANGTTPSYFNNQADALAVEWSFINDSSVYVVQLNTGAENLGPGWRAYAEVEIYDIVTPTQFGSVSIQALNPNATDPDNGEKAYVNFTLQINEEKPEYTSAAHVGYQIWIPNTTSSNQAYATTITSDFYETDMRSYPTVMDGVVEMLYSSLINQYTPFYTPGLGDGVEAFTIGGTTYANNAREGWQYRVYRQVGQFYTILPMSSVVGPDAVKLLKDDIVVWKFGIYGDPDLFEAVVLSW
jgi:hypothetical protein